MRLQLGYVPLSDAAVLIAAVECGFAAQEGVAADLVPEPSWATLRDKLALGCSTAPTCSRALALACHLGLSGPQARLVAPAALARNGNAVTVSLPLWLAMRRPPTPRRGGPRLVTVARARHREGRPLTLATVHPFSSHTYQLRRLLALGGGGLDLVRLVVVPPPRTADSLERGEIDGFWSGAPWNSVAVAAGAGRIAVLGCEIAPDCPEKVLALPAEMAASAPPLLRALRRAARWCAEPEHWPALAARVAGSAHLGSTPASSCAACPGRLRRPRRNGKRATPTT